MRTSLTLKVIATAIAALLLQGCFHDGDSPPSSGTPPDDSPSLQRQFQVDVTNLTQNQAISPVAVILHRTAYQPFMMGEKSSMALEILAEGGDNNALLADANTNVEVFDTASGSAKIVVGASERFMLAGTSSEYQLSLAGMLVNTNDGFAALNGADVDQLTAGASITFYANVYDAGTEGNSEAASDLPGQGGEGFNAVRNDSDFIIIHPGVVSAIDGLETSVLDQSHRFDNPAMKVQVTRLQ